MDELENEGVGGPVLRESQVKKTKDEDRGLVRLETNLNQPRDDNVQSAATASCIA